MDYQEKQKHLLNKQQSFLGESQIIYCKLPKSEFWMSATISFAFHILR